MKEVEVFKFWTKAPWEKRLTLTRYTMTREEAAKRFPGCTPDLSSREVRTVCSTDAEVRKEMAKWSSPPMRQSGIGPDGKLSK